MDSDTRLEADVDGEVDVLLREAAQLLSTWDVLGAIKRYTQCILKYQQFEGLLARRTILLSTYVSRSEAYLWLDKHEKALEDAERALQLDSRHVIGLFCKSQALYHQGRCEEACKVLTVALNLKSTDEAIRDTLGKAIVGYLQSRGVYDLEDFLLAGCQGPAPSCSDYIGPIQIQFMDRGGRGLVAKEAVEAGQLLLVSNALSMASNPTEACPTEARVTKQNHDFLVEDLKQQLISSTKVRVGLQVLAHDPDPHDFKEVSHMERSTLAKDEHWQSEISPMERSKLAKDSQCQQSHIIKKWLSGIVQINAIDALKCIDPVPFGDIKTPSSMNLGEGKMASGIWVLPSLINHSCVSNINLMFVGKAMFIRASRDVAKGEELTLSYRDPYKPEECRQDSLKWWKFSCTCERCMLEQTLEKHQDAMPHDCLTLEPIHPFLQNYLSSEKLVMKLYKTHCKLVENGQRNELTGIVYEVERLIESAASNMGTRLQNWLRAPFIEAYFETILVHKDDLPKKVECLNRTLDIMLSVAGGNEGAMQISATLLRDSKLLYGEFSADYRNTENRVMDVCRATLGQHSREFFLALIATRFNSVIQALS